MPSTLVITGPPCAGKTTSAERLTADGFGDGKPCALVDLDRLRWQVRHGLRPPMEVPPGEEAQLQWQIAVDFAAHMARRYDAIGYRCVIDAPGIYVDHTIPWRPYRHAAWAEALDGIDWRLVVLLPDVELVCARARERTDGRQPPEEAMRWFHDALSHWRAVEGVDVIDSTGMTVEHVVEELRLRG